MKLLLIGDGHITDIKPERRKDENFLATGLSKIDQARMIGERNNCDIAIQVGDIGETPRISRRAIAELIECLSRFIIPFYSICGQHDITGHTMKTYDDCAHRVLASAKVTKLLSFNPVMKNNIHIYGASFGEAIPKVLDSTKYNILVIHAMIGNDLLYPGQDIVYPEAFLRQHPEFQLVVCGDYHYRFVVEYKGRYCVNPGALLRLTINERDLAHKPGVVVFDTDSNKFDIIKFTVIPSEEIFDLHRKEQEEDKDKAQAEALLLQFIENLKKSERTGVKWTEVLQKLLIEKNVSDELKATVEEILKKYSQQLKG